MAKSSKSVVATSAETKTKEDSKSKEKVVVKANAKLVALFRQYDDAAKEHSSSLVRVAEFVQSNSITRAEVVVSMMEARGIEKVSADSQYSRIKKILTDPKILQELKDGTLTLKEARAKSTKKQENPNKEKQRENLEKRFNRVLTELAAIAKEGGFDLRSTVNSVSATLKKAGIK